MAAGGGRGRPHARLPGTRTRLRQPGYVAAGCYLGSDLSHLRHGYRTLPAGRIRHRRHSRHDHRGHSVLGQHRPCLDHPAYQLGATMAVGDILADAGTGVPSWVAKATAMASNYYVLTNVSGVPGWVHAGSVAGRTVLTVSGAHLPCWQASYSGGNGLNAPRGIAVVGTQVWVADYGAASISRFNLDGSAYGAALSGNGLYGPWGIVVVGTEVWVANNNSTISRFNLDGTVYSGGNIATHFNGLNGPRCMAVVGSQVWVTNGDIPGTISRFNTDGTAYGGGNLSGNGMSNITGIAVVGSTVWVVNYTYNTISRFNLDGTVYSGGNIAAGFNWMATPDGLSVVGSHVWVTNFSASTISQFNPDGSSAGTVWSGNGPNGPVGVADVGTEVWVANVAASTISRFNTSGGIAASPILPT